MSIVKYLVVGLLIYMMIVGLFTLRISGEDVNIGFNYMKVGERIVKDVSNLVEQNKMRNENKLGRKFTACWGKPSNRIAKRMANKGVRRNSKLKLMYVKQKIWSSYEYDIV